MELLSPAGSREALLAALRMGADAVYMGASAFGARASAGFDEATLNDAVRLAHLNRRKIYVTVNTLARDGELKELEKLLVSLARMRVDAVLVQDMAVLAAIRARELPLCVHASTQMSVHNAAGAAFLKSEGVSRVVLARECSLAQIKRVADAGIETEVFAHGALCVSVSGQCQMSALIGGRSGNRGRCAQPCRLPYVYEGKKGAWLSPRDICLRDDLPALKDAGVASIKLEGRLKRPEYVAVITRAYRHALDALEAGTFAPADTDEKRDLLQAFSRGGFTRGYALSARDAGIIYPQNAAHEGLPLGEVIRVYESKGTPFCEIKTQTSLDRGDGLKVGNQEILYSGEDRQANSTATLRLREMAKPGDRVQRLTSEKLFARARADCEGEVARIPFDARLRAMPGEPCALWVTDGRVSASVTGDAAQAAEGKPLSEESVRRALGKTGGTPFVLEKCALQSSGAFVSAAALNALRREALARLADARIAAFEDSRAPLPAASPRKRAPENRFEGYRLLAKSARAEDGELLLSAGADAFLYAPNAFPPCKCLPRDSILCLPTQCADDTLLALRDFASANNLPVALGSVGQLGMSFHTPVMAGAGVPVYNAETARFLRERGCFAHVISCELSRAQAEAMFAPDSAIIAYGRARMMLLNHCPARTALSLSGARGDCALCASGKGCEGKTLRDRTGAEFPLIPCHLPEGCVIALHADKQTAILPPREIRWILEFTTESTQERIAVVRQYRALLSGLPGDIPAGIPGRWLRGVE